MKKAFEKLIGRLEELGWVFADYYPDGTEIHKVRKKSVAYDDVISIVNQLAEEYLNDSKIIVNKDIKNPFANISTVGCVNCDHKDEYIVELEADNGWIPCSERLPENVDFVIYTHKDGDVDVCSIEYFYDYLDKFVAWQSLPEPYTPLTNSKIPNSSINETWKQQTMNRFERVE